MTMSVPVEEGVAVAITSACTRHAADERDRRQIKVRKNSKNDLGRIGHLSHVVIYRLLIVDELLKQIAD
jgi:hypothetical protein